MCENSEMAFNGFMEFFQKGKVSFWEDDFSRTFNDFHGLFVTFPDVSAEEAVHAGHDPVFVAQTSAGQSPVRN